MEDQPLHPGPRKRPENISLAKKEKKILLKHPYRIAPALAGLTGTASPTAHFAFSTGLTCEVHSLSPFNERVHDPIQLNEPLKRVDKDMGVLSLINCSRIALMEDSPYRMLTYDVRE